VNDSHLIEELLGLLQKMHEERGVPQGESLENKNILQGNSPSDPNNRVSPTLNSNERKRTTEIATIFAMALRAYNQKYKKDEKPPTLISQSQRRIENTQPSKEGTKGGMMLAGLLLLLGGVGALIYGLLNDGPLKGVMKLLSKIGIKGGIKLLTGAVKRFVGFIGKFLKAPFKILMNLAKMIFKPFAGMIGKLIPSGIKNLGKGLIGRIVKGLAPLLKILKKVPIIGSIISIGFAISRFKSGDNIGGVIDVLSALAGLLNLIPGGSIIAIPLAIGFDLLNAFLDVKTAGAKDKQGAKMDILKSMGGWIMNKFKENAIYMPIIGGVMRFGRAFDAFKGGNIMDGLKELGLGLLTFVGGGPIIMGINMLMDFFGGNKDEEGSLNGDSSWKDRLKKWIVSKLGDLPYAIRKPLEWFGIIDGSSEPSQTWEGVKGAASKGMESITNVVSNTWGNISEASSIVFDSVKNFMSETWEDLKKVTSIGIAYIREKAPAIIKSVKSIFSKVVDGIKGIAKSVGNWIKKLNIFGGNEKSGDMSESEKTKRAKAAGYSSWEEYKASGWKWKSTGISSVVQEGKPESVDHLREAAKIQIKLLGEISHWGKLSLIELKRMSGSGGGGGNVSVNASMPSSPSQSLEMVGDNRNGYASSVYALA
jgi:hypothetical protein